LAGRREYLPASAYLLQVISSARLSQLVLVRDQVESLCHQFTLASSFRIAGCHAPDGSRVFPAFPIEC
jgi:hypothetical protein